MLVLTRKPGETVVLNNNITVTVASVVGNKVRLAFSAPDDVRILRGELACWLADETSPAMARNTVAPAELVCASAVGKSR